MAVATEKVHEDIMVTSKFCKNDFPASICTKCGDNSFACCPCNTLHSRINRHYRSILGDVARPWANQEEREKFFNDHRGESAESTKKMLMTITSSKEQKNSMTASVNWVSDWLDEEDLNDRFKHKPDQLASILQHAKTMFHPHRKVKLYQVLDVKSNEGQETAVEERHKQEVQSQVPEKKRKRLEGDRLGLPAEQGEGGEVGGGQPTRKTPKQAPKVALTEPQRKRFQNVADKLKELLDAQGKIATEAKENGTEANFPPCLIARGPTFVAEVVAVAAAVRVALEEEGWAATAADTKQLEQDARAKLKATKEFIEQLRQAKDLAKAIMDQSGA